MVEMKMKLVVLVELFGLDLKIEKMQDARR